MKYYSDIKDTILYYDPLVGSLTLDDLLGYIESCLEETQIFEKTVSKILYQNPNSKQIADKIMNLTMTSTVKFLIDLIKDKL